jgi:hypothetical protein
MRKRITPLLPVAYNQKPTAMTLARHSRPERHGKSLHRALSVSHPPPWGSGRAASGFVALRGASFTPPPPGARAGVLWIRCIARCKFHTLPPPGRSGRGASDSLHCAVQVSPPLPPGARAGCFGFVALRGASFTPPPPRYWCRFFSLVGDPSADRCNWRQKPRNDASMKRSGPAIVSSVGKNRQTCCVRAMNETIQLRGAVAEGPNPPTRPFTNETGHHGQKAVYA